MIRRWTLSDNPTVAKIEQNSFSDPWTEEMLEQSLSSPAFHGFVLEVDGQVCGYVGLLCAFDAEITLIAVDGALRRRGYGKQLLDYGVEFARQMGCENVFLEVRQSNVSAKALYQKAGFKSIAVRPRYYADGEDAIVMVLPTDYTTVTEEKK